MNDDPLTYGSTGPNDPDYDPRLPKIKIQYPEGSISRDSAVMQYALERDRERRNERARINRTQICAAAGIAAQTLKNRLWENKKQGDPAPVEQSDGWSYAVIRPWLVRQFPKRAAFFPPDFADFMRQSQVSE